MLDFGETVNAFARPFLRKGGQSAIFSRSVKERREKDGIFYGKLLQKRQIFDKIMSFWRVFPCFDAAGKCSFFFGKFCACFLRAIAVQ